MTVHHPLHDGWSLVSPQATVPATVPGCVHTDLLAAGLIPDPYLDDNEERLAWIGRAEWAYTVDFNLDSRLAAAERVDLDCAGLDTVATLTLNGVTIGETANMHRRYRFAVGHLLRVRNQLRVTFHSPYEYAESVRTALGSRPGAYDEPLNFIRKMACNFGWDWGPKLVTAGIWRPIGLTGWSTGRFTDVRVLSTGDGVVQAHAAVDRTSDTPLTVTVSVAGASASAPAGDSATVWVTAESFERWWPRGYGEQPLYDCVVTLSTPDGTVLDTVTRRIGFRSVHLDTTPDAAGTPYAISVNGVPVFVRGVNWIPDDCFPSRVTRSRLAGRFDQAAGANVNYLRVWGGGVYESDDFYELADERGLLVGQDFLFACSAYPEEPPIGAEVEAEARDNVARLAHHPSLVVWTGNNECQWGHADWGWRSTLNDQTWGSGYYDDVLPAVVSELDPTRPYWPGSPWSGSAALHPNDPDHGTTHIWDVWNTDDYTRYRHYRPRFVGEFGYQAPPAYATLRRALSDKPLRTDSPGLRHHQKAIDGDLKLHRGLDAHLPPPRDFDDWLWLTQLNQARAVELGVTHFRSLQPHCQGTIVWQLNDCWPVTSWSAVDGDGRRKPLWYALRRAYADRLLTIQPTLSGLSLVAVNDTTTAWETTVSIARSGLDGRTLAKTAGVLDVPAHSAAAIALPVGVATPDDPLCELLIATPDRGDHERALWFFAEDREAAYPPAEFDTSITSTVDSAVVTVTARTILRDLTLFPDRLDPAATVDRALVTLLPGESATFTVTGTFADPSALGRRPVLRCVNDLAPLA